MQFKNPERIVLESVASTNDYAMELLAVRKPPEGTVIVARDQTNGRGQGENRWESEPGRNLTATIVLYPYFIKPEHQFMLTKVVSLSVCSLLEKSGIPAEVSIKWPNDIYAGRFKIAGILIKNEISGSVISAAIAGLGLNVNQTEFPADRFKAISLKILSGKEYNPDHILTEWHKLLDYWYQLLARGETNLIDEEYLKRLYRLNIEAPYSINGRRTEATIRGLAGYGMLHLTEKNGNEIICDLKEIVFLEE